MQNSEMSHCFWNNIRALGMSVTCSQLCLVFGLDSEVYCVFSSSILYFRHDLLICQLRHGGLLIPSRLQLHWLSCVHVLHFNLTGLETKVMQGTKMERDTSTLTGDPHRGADSDIETMVEQRLRRSWWGWQPEQSWRPPQSSHDRTVSLEGHGRIRQKGDIKVQTQDKCDSVTQP